MPLEPALGRSLSPIISSALITFTIYHKYEIPPSHLALTLFLLLLFPLATSFLTSSFQSYGAFKLFASLALYHATLLLSVTLYRISPLHPLAAYPGPLLPRISRLYLVWLTRTGKQHLWYRRMHDKYGPYVRVGPNELSFADADAIEPVLNSKVMFRGPMYDGRWSGTPSLIALRDPGAHAARRKTWVRGFTPAALRSYEPTLERRVRQLVTMLEERAYQGLNPEREQEVDLARCFSYFASDFMGDMAFGGGFELMRDGDKHGLWKNISSFWDIIAPIEHIPWVARLLNRMPVGKAGITIYRAFVAECVYARKAHPPVVKDLFHHIADEANADPSPPSLPLIMADASLAIIAGSDTTAGALAGIFARLLAHPKALEKLKEEIDRRCPCAQREADLDMRVLEEMPYLNAVINEGLRLQPALHTRLQRTPVAGSGGCWVGKHFIPEGISVQIPMYVIHRHPAHFSPEPESFLPERWLDLTPDLAEPQFHTDPAAFLPFSVGSANCVGRRLALREMRAVLVRVLQSCELRFARGFTLEMWEEGVRDMYITEVGKLPVVLTRRGMAV